jgi:phage terminase large subunit-like protein
LKINLARLEELRRTDPAEAKRMEEAIARVREAQEQNPLLFFKPHKKQRHFLAAHTSVKAFLGGNRSGKTTAGIVDDLIQAVDRDVLSDHLLEAKRWEPPFHCRIVTPDFTSTMEGVVFQKLREWAPKSQLLGGSWDKAYDKQLRKLRFANGSWLDFMTFEQDLDKFGGAALHRVHYDEEPPEAIRKECQARLIDHAGDELFTMTPLLGMTWMYDGIYERRDDGNVSVVEVATDENPHLDRAAMEEFFASLTPEEQDARRKGRFVHFGGLVLKGWDDGRHLCDPVDPAHLQGQDVIVGIDPGITRGAVVWVAYDKDDVMLVFDELYPHNQDARQVAAQIREKNQRWGIEPLYYVMDPSGRNRTMAGTVSDEFAAAGIYCSYGNNAREGSILQLRRRLHSGAIVISRDCTNWLWEKSRWRVAEDEESGQEKTSGDTFKTIGPDHLMDATRYVAMERVWGPAPDRNPRQRVWTPGVAPSADWFSQCRSQQVGPMGSLS